MNVDDIVKGLVTGVLLGFMVLYSLRPQNPYPDWVLQTYEHPWIFIILVGSVIILSAWEGRAGAIMLIIVATLLMDYYFLGTRSLQHEQHAPVFLEFDRNAISLPSTTQSTQYSLKQAYPIFNNDSDSLPGHPSLF